MTTDPNVSRLNIIGTVIETAAVQESRPLRTFLKRPRLPIREVYMTRFLVNLVWFSRNYLNITLICGIACALMYPFLAVPLLLALWMHISKQRTGQGFMLTPLKAVQALSCVWMIRTYGVAVPVLAVAVPTLFVCAHALFTPYTDEAFVHYENTMKQRGIIIPAPRSPTTDFQQVDEMFARALDEERKKNSSLGSGSTPKQHKTPKFSAPKGPLPEKDRKLASGSEYNSSTSTFPAAATF
jgi:hypothetical protein